MSNEFLLRCAQPVACLCADPPWDYDDPLPGPKRGAEKIYRNTLTVSEIIRLPLPPLAPHCFLVLWTTAAFQEEARLVARAWGFVPTGGEFVWVKKTKRGRQHFGMGRTVRHGHETALIFRRGRPTRASASVSSVIEAPVVYGRDKRIAHSAKPEEFYRRVEALCYGPYCDLFARIHRPGWLCIGNELPTLTALPPPSGEIYDGNDQDDVILEVMKLLGAREGEELLDLAHRIAAERQASTHVDRHIDHRIEIEEAARDAATESRWKERQGEEYGSY